MISNTLRNKQILLFIGFLFYQFTLFANPNDFPALSNPPRLVNDFAGMMTPLQQDNLEQQLLAFSKETSNEITIITVNSIGEYATSQYVTELGNKWGIGRGNKDNGVIIFASKNDRKLNISPGMGLEGALTDVMAGRIIRNEMAPEFKQENYFAGFQKAANAVMAATKGEYKPDESAEKAPPGLGILVL